MILKINDRLKNRRVDWFTDFKFSLKYNSIASDFSLGYYFDPDNFEHKEFSCVGHYHLATLEENNELLMSVIILSIQFQDSLAKELTRISGYSLPGVLEDCQIPKQAYPLKSINLNLIQIVDKFVKPFGLKYVIDSSVRSDMELPFDETEAGETQTIKSYLTELASQRNIIMSHDEKGRIVFTRPDPSKQPIFDFTQGMPGVKYTMAFNGQGIHSDILAMMQADIDDDNGVESEITNSFVPIVYRPIVTVVSSGNGLTVEKAANNLRAEELRNIPLVIELDRWTLNNKIIRPGEFITVTNKNIYLYEKSKWFIESVDFFGDSEKQTATLNCVRPEVYTGQVPQYLWKGYNLH